MVFIHDPPLGMGSSQPSFCEAIENLGGQGEEQSEDVRKSADGQ